MKKIAFCGGGSAGHVTPNIALCEILKDNYELVYIGTDGIEKQICKNFGIAFYEYNGVKLVRGKILCNLSIPFKLIKSVGQCKTILKKIRPDLLFCKGGYVSLPPALAAHRLGIPVITHESDVSAGLANKLIASRSEVVLTSFPSTAESFANGKFVGSPIRKELFGRDRQSARRQLRLDNRATILVFGGGSGSKIINDCLRKIVADLTKDYNVLHLCGRGNAVDSNIRGYKQIEFCEDMGLVYACADYAVARCGSNSAHELITLKKPTLFIPLDNGSSRGDQVLNAEFFKQRGLCRVLSERELSPQTLAAAIRELISDEKIKSALDAYDAGCGNEMIIKEIERVINL